MPVADQNLICLFWQWTHDQIWNMRRNKHCLPGEVRWHFGLSLPSWRD